MVLTLNERSEIPLVLVPGRHNISLSVFYLSSLYRVFASLSDARYESILAISPGKFRLILGCGLVNFSSNVEKGYLFFVKLTAKPHTPLSNM